MTSDERAFLELMRALLPPRGARRPALADWLCLHDIVDAWRQVRDGAIRPEPIR